MNAYEPVSNAWEKHRDVLLAGLESNEEIRFAAEGQVTAYRRLADAAMLPARCGDMKSWKDFWKLCEDEICPADERRCKVQPEAPPFLPVAALSFWNDEILGAAGIIRASAEREICGLSDIARSRDAVKVFFVAAHADDSAGRADDLKIVFEARRLRDELMDGPYGFFASSGRCSAPEFVEYFPALQLAANLRSSGYENVFGGHGPAANDAHGAFWAGRWADKFGVDCDLSADASGFLCLLGDKDMKELVRADAPLFADALDFAPWGEKLRNALARFRLFADGAESLRTLFPPRKAENGGWEAGWPCRFGVVRHVAKCLEGEAPWLADGKLAQECVLNARELGLKAFGRLADALAKAAGLARKLHEGRAPVKSLLNEDEAESLMSLLTRISG